MNENAAQAAMTRARKAYRHAAAQLDTAESPKARQRHARRLRQAERLMGEARRAFETVARFSI